MIATPQALQTVTDRSGLDIFVILTLVNAIFLILLAARMSLSWCVLHIRHVQSLSCNDRELFLYPHGHNLLDGSNCPINFS